MAKMTFQKGLTIKKVDPLKEKLDKLLGPQSDEAVTKIKELIEELKKSKNPSEKKTEDVPKKESDEADKAEDDTPNLKRRAGALDIILLMKVKDTALVPSTDTSDQSEATSETTKDETKKEEKADEKKVEKKEIEMNCVNNEIVMREGRLIDAVFKKGKGGPMKNMERGQH